MKIPLSVTIIAKNEEARIAKAIQSASFASEIIVVDSQSIDRTRSIAESLGAKVFTKAFEGFGQQKNFAQENATQDWVLNIDADEIISPDLAKEIATAIQSKDVQGYRIPRKTWYANRWILHSGWYPNYLVRLARRNSAVWTTPSLHEELKVTGEVRSLENPIEHYSFPNVRSHLEKNLEYADRARYQTSCTKGRPHFFHWMFKPTWKFIHMYFIKCGFLDGTAGFIIAVNSAYSMFLKYAYQWEATTRENSNHRQ